MVLRMLSVPTSKVCAISYRGTCTRRRSSTPQNPRGLPRARVRRVLSTHTIGRCRKRIRSSGFPLTIVSRTPRPGAYGGQPNESVPHFLVSSDIARGGIPGGERLLYLYPLGPRALGRHGYIGSGHSIRLARYARMSAQGKDQNPDTQALAFAQFCPPVPGLVHAPRSRKRGQCHSPRAPNRLKSVVGRHPSPGRAS